MPAALAAYILHYGYITIFSLIFLQEIGIPSPVPNEFILLYGGYLASIGKLHFIIVFLLAVAADFIGTSVLYVVFYFFGKIIVRKKPKWLPVEKMKEYRHKLSHRGKWGIYFGRLLPYVRGYASVAAGLLHIPPEIFEPLVLLSGLTWSGGYVILGRILGARWESFAARIGIDRFALLAAVLFALLLYFVPIIERFKKTKKNA